MGSLEIGRILEMEMNLGKNANEDDDNGSTYLSY